MAKQRYAIPTHLFIPDKIDVSIVGLSIGVTLREAIILILGASCAFDLWRRLTPVELWGNLGWLLRWGLPVAIMGIAWFWGTFRWQGRVLETWLGIWFRYACVPKTVVWSCIRECEKEEEKI